MSPQSPTKPVMDVSAPRPQAAATPSADAIAVHPAPLSTESIKHALAPKAQDAHPAAAVAQPKSGAPVGVITVTVLMMMLLSAAAVIVYASSRTV